MRTLPAGSGTAKAVLSAIALSALTTLIPVHEASASLVLGEFLGVFSGNDSEEAVSTVLMKLGLDDNVLQLAKVEAPDTAMDGLVLSNPTFKDGNEIIAGEWSYAGPEIVDYLVVKAGPNFALYRYDDMLTGSMPNMGLFDTSMLMDKGFSHISVYRAHSPEPAAAGLVTLGLVALGLGRRRRR